jgi:hypothetical protein
MMAQRDRGNFSFRGSWVSRRDTTVSYPSSPRFSMPLASKRFTFPSCQVLVVLS